MNTTSIGMQAEEAVAKELIKQGFAVVERNFKRPLCEIDIVAKKEDIVYLVEVKYRSNTAWGDGLDYVTKKKQNQLKLAAQIWAKENDWAGDLRLMAAAVSTVDGVFVVGDILEIDL